MFVHEYYLFFSNWNVCSPGKMKCVYIIILICHVDTCKHTHNFDNSVILITCFNY
jgi:hypothetical protein